jgi:hypothetical protein
MEGCRVAKPKSVEELFVGHFDQGVIEQGRLGRERLDLQG